MADTTRDKFFDAINDSYEALLSAAEATQAHGHKLSRAVIDEAREGEKELVALARKWVDAPTDFFENLAAMVDAQARAQRRALELARDSLSGAGEYGSEMGEALRKVIKANRTASEATMEAARQAYSLAMERVRGTEGEPARRRPARATRIPVASADQSGSSEPTE